jgi:uncharacterized protein (DUF4415 family)
MTMCKPDYISQKDWDSVDSPPLTDEELANMRPADEVLPPAFMKAWREGRVGRPEKATKKQQISLRLDPDVISTYRAKGKGWQARMNETLRQHMTD